MRKVYATLCIALGAYGISSAEGLTLIPIADILKHREAQVAFGCAGLEQNVSKAYSFVQSGAIGLFDRFEVGYANDLLGHTAYEIEFQLFESPPDIPGSALSIGLKECMGGHREPYLVGRYDLKSFRLHGGYWNTLGQGRVFSGIDFPLPGGGAGSLEALFGHGGQSWVSVSYPVNAMPGLSILAGVGFPMRSGDGIQHTVQLSYGFKF